MEDFFTSSLWLRLRIIALVFFCAGFYMLNASIAQAATKTIVTGNVLDENGAGYPNAQIEFHTGDASVSQNFTSNSSGAFTVTYEEDTINGKSMTVEMRKPDGYAQVQNSPYIFTYAKGDATRTVTFNLIKSGKTINVTVKTEDGKNVESADIGCTSSDPSTAGTGSGSIQNGTGTIEVVGGTWYCKADKNLSEQNASRYPWVPIGTAQKVEFADDSTEESADISFTVAKADITVSVKPVDKDGNTLTSNDFKGDVVYSCYNDTYGEYVTRNKVGTDGTSNIDLLSGVCTIQAFHQILEGQSYDPATTTFVVPEGESAVDVGELQAVENNGRIKGEVDFLTTNAPTGEKVSGVMITTTNLDTGQRFQNGTFNDGTFDVQHVGPGNYSIAVDQDGYISVLAANVEVGAGETVSGLTIRGARADTTVRGTLKLNNQAAENVPGTVVVEGNGVTFSAPVAADGSFELQMYTAGLPDDNMELRLVTQTGAEVYATDTASVPVVPNSTFSADITVKNDEGTIAGKLTDPSGTALSASAFGDDAKILAINVADGSVEEATIESDGSYSLDVGPGNWELYPRINDKSAITFSGLVSDQRVEVSAGATESGTNVPVLKAQGSVHGAIEDTNGKAVVEAPVMLTNLPALEAAGNVDPKDIISVTTTTDENGEFTQDLPNGTYTAYFGSNPNVADLIEPTAVQVTVKGNDAIANGSYREAVATVEGSMENGIDSGKMTFYSEQGGTETVSVDADGSFSSALAPGSWSYVASGVKNGNLWTNQGTMDVSSGKNSLEPTMENTGVAFPGSVSKTADVSETIALSNSDGASVMIPPYATGFEGDVTVELSPDPTLQFSNGIAQVGFAYNVEIRDSDGFPVAKLNLPATVTLPIDQEFANGVDTDSLTPASFNKDLDTYLYDGMVADTNSKQMVIQTTHMSRFAVTTTTGALSETASSPQAPKKLKAKKITTTGAQLTWKASAGATKYKVQLRKFKVAKQKQWTTYKKVKKAKKIVSGLITKTRYQFRVAACDAQGCSGYTQWTAFKTR